MDLQCVDTPELGLSSRIVAERFIVGELLDPLPVQLDCDGLVAGPSDRMHCLNDLLE